MTVIIKLCFPNKIYKEMKRSGMVSCSEKFRKGYDHSYTRVPTSTKTTVFGTCCALDLPDIHDCKSLASIATSFDHSCKFLGAL